MDELSRNTCSKIAAVLANTETLKPPLNIFSYHYLSIRFSYVTRTDVN